MGSESQEPQRPVVGKTAVAAKLKGVEAGAGVFKSQKRKNFVRINLKVCPAMCAEQGSAATAIVNWQATLASLFCLACLDSVKRRAHTSMALHARQTSLGRTVRHQGRRWCAGTGHAGEVQVQAWREADVETLWTLWPSQAKVGLHPFQTNVTSWL